MHAKLKRGCRKPSLNGRNRIDIRVRKRVRHHPPFCRGALCVRTGGLVFAFENGKRQRDSSGCDQLVFLGTVSYSIYMNALLHCRRLSDAGRALNKCGH